MTSTKRARAGFSVTYIREGSSSSWVGSVRRDESLDGMSRAGEVGHATAFRDGETPADDKFLLVSVVVEHDPAECLAWQMLVPEAFGLAEPALMSRHPGASVEYDFDVEV
jgi:hypothetical protein